LQNNYKCETCDKDLSTIYDVRTHTSVFRTHVIRAKDGIILTRSPLIQGILTTQRFGFQLAFAKKGNIRQTERMQEFLCWHHPMKGFRIFELEDGSIQAECKDLDCKSRFTISVAMDDKTRMKIYGDQLAEFDAADCGCGEAWCLICHPDEQKGELDTPGIAEKSATQTN